MRTFHHSDGADASPRWASTSSGTDVAGRASVSRRGGGPACGSSCGGECTRSAAPGRAETFALCYGFARGESMERTFFALGALSAGVAVAAGAFGAHALRERVSPELLAVFE